MGRFYSRGRGVRGSLCKVILARFKRSFPGISGISDCLGGVRCYCQGPAIGGNGLVRAGVWFQCCLTLTLELQTYIYMYITCIYVYICIFILYVFMYK